MRRVWRRARQMPQAEHIAKKNAQGVLHQHGNNKSIHVVTQSICKAFLIGIAGKQLLKVFQPDKLAPDQLVPAEKAVKQRHEQGQQNKNKNDGSAGQNEEGDPGGLLPSFGPWSWRYLLAAGIVIEKVNGRSRMDGSSRCVAKSYFWKGS